MLPSEQWLILTQVSLSSSENTTVLQTLMLDIYCVFHGLGPGTGTVVQGRGEVAHGQAL